MKKLISLLGALGLTVSGSTIVVACSNIPTNSEANNSTSNDNQNEQEEQKWPIVSEYSEDFEVYGESLSDWKLIKSTYEEQVEINKKVYDDLIDSTNDIDKLFFNIANLYMSWYNAIVYDADIYIYLYENNLDIAKYENNEFENNFTNDQLNYINTKLTLQNLTFPVIISSIGYFEEKYAELHDDGESLERMYNLRAFMVNWQNEVTEKMELISTILEAQK